MNELAKESRLPSLGQIFCSRLANLFRQRARARKQFGNPARQFFRFEPLENRLLLSADLSAVAVLEPPASLAYQTASRPIVAPVGGPAIDLATDPRSSARRELPPLRLVDPEPSLAGQVFYLDHDGAAAVTYDGPVRIESIDVPSFLAPGSLQTEESSIVASVLAQLNEAFADLGVTFTGVRPDPGTEYSTIFLGGDDSAFSQYGSFLSLAENVDIGNQDRDDNAFVFSDTVYAPGMTLEVYASWLTALIDHEARHLLGYAHATGETAGVDGVAAGAPDLPAGATITVNSALDNDVRDEWLTLREAILVSNGTLPVSDLDVRERPQVTGTPAALSRDIIEFKIGEGQQVILVGVGGLPLITDSVIIDGTTQPGFSFATHMPIIAIDASSAGANPRGFAASGLEIAAGNSVVKGLVIGAAPGAGIALLLGGANTIVGNFLGTDYTGTQGGIFGNRDGILIVDSADNQIGGANPGERNLISGNRVTGISILNGGSTGNEVQGNLIGTDISGTGPLGNGADGVLISALIGLTDYASDNLIGGSSPGQGNVISANGQSGVEVVRGAGNRIQGNVIGTIDDGTTGLGNVRNGVWIIDASDTLIGGEEVWEQNVISANGLHGIEIAGIRARNTVVQNNFIGTDITGERDLGNGGDGVFLGEVPPGLGGSITGGVVGAPSATTIGGTSADARNLISGNDRDGVHIEAGTTGTLVQGNFIGLVFGGDSPLRNTGDGVAILDSPDNTIGGVVDEENDVIPRNVISANEGAGVRISGDDSSNNHVLGNYIGTDKEGETATSIGGDLGNRGAGVVIDDAGGVKVGEEILQPGNVIGDTTAGGRNVISGNRSSGVLITGHSQHNTVLGNYIGTDRLGSSEVPNEGVGVFIQGKETPGIVPSGNTIGGDSAAARNVISGNKSHGVEIAFGAFRNNVWGNFIGTKADGIEPLGNAGFGVLILGASDNDIGGLAPEPGAAPGNVISGNRDGGVQIRSFGELAGPIDSPARSSLAAQNRVRGNIIGLDASGTASDDPSAPSTWMKNGGAGVSIDGGFDNTIGGTTPSERNIISGNLTYGVSIVGFQGERENKVLGNFIGTDISGTSARENGLDGVFIDAWETIIGGATDGAGNVISGNGENGIEILVGAGTLIQGNYVGTDYTGNQRLSNRLDGVRITGVARDNTVGGLTEKARNVIAGNAASGVQISGENVTKNRVQGNYIGAGADGVAQLGNAHYGVLVDGAPDNTIGGAENGAGNVIAFNGAGLFQRGHGVRVASGTGNLISRNSIYDNAGRGIDLGDVGPAADSFTLNDVGDADTGANNLQDYPVVIRVEFLGVLKRITWNLDSAPNSDFTIEFFANDTPDPSGFGEGKIFLNSIVVTTDDDGFIEFSETFGAGDTFISATATDSGNNTSEFSMVDTDGDALADAWEDAGIAGFIDFNEDAIPDVFVAGAVNSQGLGVSPDRKDLFVEVDAMGLVSGPLAQYPDPATLPLVEEAFAAAGIALHAILDETNISPSPFPLTVAGNTTWPEFDTLKASRFGTPAERNNPDGSPNANWSSYGRAAKQLVYRYALFADQYGPPGRTGSSGLSELADKQLAGGEFMGFGGSDFMVTLGTFLRDQGPDGLWNTPDDRFGGANSAQASTFMHELGHTLGLFHPGDQGDERFNFKPNYHSVMNYLWQLPARWMGEGEDLDGDGIVQPREDRNSNGILDPGPTDLNGNGSFTDSTWVLNYSDRDFGDLDENNLDEARGINGHLGHWVSAGPLVAGNPQLVPESGPVNWNLDGDTNDSGVSADTNRNIPGNVAGPSPGQILRGYETWPYLRFYFGELPNLRAGAHGAAVPEEITVDIQEALDAVGQGPGHFRFSQTNAFEVGEAAGFATLTVTRAGGMHGTVSVDFSTADGSALAGDDYVTTSGTLTFAAGEYIKTFTIPILNDLVRETIETIRLALSNPTGGATLDQTGTALVRVLDDDGPGDLQLSSPSFLAKETDPAAVVTVTRTGGTVGEVSVKFTTENSLATAGQDYTAVSGMLTFAAGESSKTFTVPILDDALVEGIESIRLVLSDPTGGAGLGRFSEGTLILQDVESGTLQFSDAVYEVAESGGLATITVTRTNGVDGAVSVNFATGNASATAGADYTAVSGTLTFNDGESVKTFTVPVLNDVLSEGTESLNLVLSNPTGGAALGAQRNAQLGILDDEAALFAFAASSFDVNENAGTATVRVVRIGNTGDNASVEFVTADGTASAGKDYVRSSGTLTFVAGETSRTFSVSVVNDRLGEGIKTLQLLLRNPRGDAALGEPATAALRIIDDETVNAATFVVTNTNDSGAGSLRQAILGANARAGTDFISFDIPGAGVHKIRPLSVLPTITSPVTLDGYSQPGARPNTLASGDDAILLVELDNGGVIANEVLSGLRIAAGDSIVRGLVINRGAGSVGLPRDGILLETKGGNLVEGNFIGTDATGLVDLGNLSGLRILNSSGNVIGGTAPASRNIIAGNDSTGISIDSPLGTSNQLLSRGNLILGNYVGIAADGASALGNRIGIWIDTNDGTGGSGLPPGNVVGSIQPGAGNVIAFNTVEGVSIASGRGNSIRGNSIFSNDPLGQNANSGGGLGIDLGTATSDPITLNDWQDMDTGDRTFTDPDITAPGANLLQNFPVLSSAISSSEAIAIRGRLDSTPKTTFQIDFYASEHMDPSGYGEGQTYIGTASVTTDALGHAEFSAAFQGEVPNGRLVTATATDAGNNTSEFSARVEVGDVLGDTFVVNSTDDTDDGIADAQHTSLREAIHAANNHPGRDTIRFSIPGEGVRTILPLFPLPPVTDPVIIDGYTQPGARLNSQAVGFDGMLLIEIQGRLGIAGGDSIVRGLVISDLLVRSGPLPWGRNVIEGNIIGLDPTGNFKPSAAGAMTVVASTFNTIGGAAPHARNLIGGLALEGADRNSVWGNYIGTRADGMGLLSGARRAFGLEIDGSSGNLIFKNVISGNTSGGIDILGSSSLNRVLGNFIGVGADGILPLGNGGTGGTGAALAGIAISGGSGNTIGGIQPGAGNIIAWNNGGVAVSVDGVGRVPDRNAVRGNSIYSNGLIASAAAVGAGLGIDLSGDIYFAYGTVTRNDNGDLAFGPNGLQNFPVLSSARSANGVLTIQGRLRSTPSEVFHIDFYASEQLHPSGYGEGQTYIGTASVTTDALGHAEFSAAFQGEVPNGRLVTATATDAGNNTSEFSARIAVGDVLGETFVVNSTDDTDDGIADGQHTSLREAIHAANNHPGHDTIRFDIPGEGVRTILPGIPLPAVTDAVTIDGYTQPGARPNTLVEGDDAVLLIELDGSQLATSVRVGLDIRGGDSTVRGLVINTFRQGGIRLIENGSNVIEGNFLGTDPTGMTASDEAGVRIFASSGNLIGGAVPEARNVISGNFISGLVDISGGSGPASVPDPATFYAASGNRVQGNFIGTDRTGSMRLGSNRVSVSDSHGNLIGGTAPEARNVIAAEVRLGGHAVAGTSANNVLRGNFIGTDVTGEVALVGAGGVVVTGIGNIVAGNLIAGATSNNIGLSVGTSSSLPGEGSHVVQGNRIGTDKDGTSAVGKRGDGIRIFSSGNTIGGLEPGAGNLVSGNEGNGIVLTQGTGNVIQGNLIGTQADGVSPLPNLGDGINVAGAIDTAIGGLSSGAGNIIAYNGGNGVNVAVGTRIAIRSNSIFSNGRLGIDLNADGPTPNDAADGDAGDNNLQNFPVLSSIINTGDGVTVGGTLNSRPNSTYRLEFFDDIAFDSSNFGEGRHFIGAASATTDASGNAAFTVTFPVAVPLTHIITATATDALGNTSEFSGRQPNASPGETANLSVALVDAPDPVLAGQLLTYDITVANNGPDDATNVIVLDTLPAGVTFASATLSQGVYGLMAGTVFSSLGTVASGATATVQIRVVRTTTGVISNSVRVASDQYDSDLNNNAASASTTVTPGADLSVTKSANAIEPIVVGSEIPFTITVANHGPFAASAVRVTDTLPASMTFDHFSGGITGTHSAGVVAWDLGSLASGASRTLSFSAIINVAGTSTDTVLVASTTGDPDPANNVATLDIVAAGAVNQPPELAIIGDHTVAEGALEVIAVSVTDPDGDAIALSAAGLPVFASFTDNGDGSGMVSVNPGFDDAGVYAGIVITASDGSAGDSESFTITVNDTNRPPVAAGDPASTGEDSPLTIHVLANDTDADGDPLETVLVTGPGHGTLVLNTDGSFTYTPAINFHGTDQFTYRASDGQAESDPATVALVITPANDPPQVEAGGGMASEEGSPVSSVGSFSDADFGDAWTATVDYGDGSGVQTLALDGTTFQLSHVYADDGLYTVTVTVADANGGVGVGTARTRVTNVAPIATLTAPPVWVRGLAVPFVGAFTDPGALDIHEVAWDFGDGTTIAPHPSTDAGALTPAHAFASTGTYTVTLAVTDDHGTSVVARTIVVQAVALLTDPCEPGALALVVGGTAGDDKVRIVPADLPGAAQPECGDQGRDHDGNRAKGVAVWLNGVSQGVFAHTGRIVVLGLAGDDDIEIAGSLANAVEFQGGAGDDRLKAGAGAALLLGGDGDDYLIGSREQDVLIGGLGKDRLVGGSGDDLLIAGRTLYDEAPHALCTIFGEWTSGAVYEARVQRLSEGVDGVRLTAETVLDDGVEDKLTGASGQDWLFATVAGLARDKFTDRHHGERLTALTPIVPETTPAPSTCKPVINWGRRDDHEEDCHDDRHDGWHKDWRGMGRWVTDFVRAPSR